MSYEVGERVITLTETRRKAASLLLFLVTRPNLTAAREQVMEGLWPDQSPKSAVNSLHQTLFYLRRDIEPWYEDGFTADYVRMETDMVFLDFGTVPGRQCRIRPAGRRYPQNWFSESPRS